MGLITMPSDQKTEAYDHEEVRLKALDAHRKRLPDKVEEDPHRPVHLLTVRGLGYKFVDDG